MQLGAIKDDLLKIFALIPGGSTATQKFAEFETLIRTTAKAGAEEAIPEIRAQVKDEVTPYTIAALGLGVAGFLTGIAALIIASRARRSSHAVSGALYGPDDDDYEDYRPRYRSRFRDHGPRRRRRRY